MGYSITTEEREIVWLRRRINITIEKIKNIEDIQLKMIYLKAVVEGLKQLDKLIDKLNQPKTEQ